MADTVSKEKRSEIMSHVTGKETKPEKIVRKYLFAQGLRYRKNVKRLPGTPDIVLQKYKAVIFVNGCFWHGHQGCKYAHLPSTNLEYWEKKIADNLAYIIHSGFISGYQNRYGDNLKPPTNVYHRMTA